MRTLPYSPQFSNELSLNFGDRSSKKFMTTRRTLGSTQPDKRVPDTPTENDGEESHRERDPSKPYPPDSIPNPMPGLDPQQSPGIDGPA